MYIEREETTAVIRAAFLVAQRESERGTERLETQSRLKIYCKSLLFSNDDFCQMMTHFVVEAVVDMVYEGGAYLNFDCYPDWTDHEDIQEEYAKYLEYWLTNTDAPEWGKG
jgi:hypothetical protein